MDNRHTIDGDDCFLFDEPEAVSLMFSDQNTPKSSLLFYFHFVYLLFIQFYMNNVSLNNVIPDEDDSGQHDSGAEMLFGLIHRQYIGTEEGLRLV